MVRGRDTGLWPGCGWVPVLTVWGVSSEALRGLSRMKSYALLQPGVVAAGAVVCMVGLGWSIVPSYAWSLVVSALLGLVLLIQALPKNKESVSALSSEWGWEAMLRTGWPMLLSSAMFLVMSWTDTLLLGHFLKEDQVGIYRVAFRLAAVVIGKAQSTVAAPLFAERHASGDCGAEVGVAPNHLAQRGVQSSGIRGLGGGSGVVVVVEKRLGRGTLPAWLEGERVVWSCR